MRKRIGWTIKSDTTIIGNMLENENGFGTLSTMHPMEAIGPMKKKTIWKVVESV